MKATFSLPGMALLLVLAILGSCQNQAIAQVVIPEKAGTRIEGVLAFAGVTLMEL